MINILDFVLFSPAGSWIPKTLSEFFKHATVLCAGQQHALEFCSARVTLASGNVTAVAQPLAGLLLEVFIPSDADKVVLLLLRNTKKREDAPHCFIKIDTEILESNVERVVIQLRDFISVFPWWGDVIVSTTVVHAVWYVHLKGLNIESNFSCKKSKTKEPRAY